MVSVDVNLPTHDKGNTLKFKTKRSVDTTKALISALISTQLIAGQVYAQTEGAAAEAPSEQGALVADTAMLRPHRQRPLRGHGLGCAHPPHEAVTGMASRRSTCGDVQNARRTRDDRRSAGRGGDETESA